MTAASLNERTETSEARSIRLMRDRSRRHKHKLRGTPTQPRRTLDELEAMLKAIQDILAAQSGPITIRHLFYLLVSAKVIDKTESEYSKLGHHLSRWRRSGDIEWDAFADATRWRYGQRGHSAPPHSLKNRSAPTATIFGTTSPITWRSGRRRTPSSPCSSMLPTRSVFK